MDERQGRVMVEVLKNTGEDWKRGIGGEDDRLS